MKALLRETISTEAVVITAVLVLTLLALVVPPYIG